MSSDANKPRTVPNAEAIAAGAPTVQLGGQAWPIPKLAIRQLRVVQHKIGPLLEFFKSETPGEMPYAHFNDMADVVFEGVCRGHPTMSRDEFENLECAPNDLTIAFLTVARVAYGTPPAETAASPA